MVSKNSSEQVIFVPNSKFCKIDDLKNIYVMNKDPENFDPDSIVEQVLGGEKDRFRLLVREYGLLVRGYLAARVYHLEDAEDLAL